MWDGQVGGSCPGEGECESGLRVKKNIQFCTSAGKRGDKTWTRRPLKNKTFKELDFYPAHISYFS